MTTDNIILLTDSYKPTQWPMYPKGTEKVYSYFEARQGAKYEDVVFFGLQSKIQQHLAGQVVTPTRIHEAKRYFDVHIGPGVFNEKGWQNILDNWDGYLPVRIWAVPEGSVNKPGDVLIVVENHGGEELAWLTNYLETLLVQTWYPSTVASLSRDTKKMIAKYLEATTGSTDGIDFMFHDFGCRGATGMEAAALGGAAHLVNFLGTDTVPALELAFRDYAANLDSLGFSVAAGEHSIMTSLGPDGEMDMVGHLLDVYPEGILAAPIDSYNYLTYPQRVAEAHGMRILERDGKFVFRPDSTSSTHETPEEEMVWLLKELLHLFGGSTNDRGYFVLNPKVGTLWGDGITPEGIEKILSAAKEEGFAASNMVFGMGGGLLQKVNRDTQRFAFKCSAQLRDGTWHDVSKKPLDATKASKAGRFDDLNLPLVFDTGRLTEAYTFEQVRKNASI